MTNGVPRLKLLHSPRLIRSQPTELLAPSRYVTSVTPYRTDSVRDRSSLRNQHTGLCRLNLRHVLML